MTNRLKLTKEWRKHLKRWDGDTYAALMDLIKNNKIDRYEFAFLVETEIVSPVVQAVHADRR